MTFLAIHIFLALDGSYGYVITACSRIMVSALDQLAEIRSAPTYCSTSITVCYTCVWPFFPSMSRLLSLQHTFNILLQKSSACLAFGPGSYTIITDWAFDFVGARCIRSQTHCALKLTESRISKCNCKKYSKTSRGIFRKTHWQIVAPPLLPAFLHPLDKRDRSAMIQQWSTPKLRLSIIPLAPEFCPVF